LLKILAEAKNQDGSQRFYPQYHHPATARLREYIKHLETFPESKERNMSLDYTRSELARFEHGEDRAKYEYIMSYLTN